MRRPLLLAVVLAAATVAVSLLWPSADRGLDRVEAVEHEALPAPSPQLLGRPPTLRALPGAAGHTAPIGSDRVLRSVRGRVVDERGDAVAGAHVHGLSVGPVFGFVSPTPLAVSDAQGRFVGSADPFIERIAVAAAAEWSGSASAALSGAGQEVILVVTRTPNLTGTVLGADGNPARNIDVRVRASGIQQELRGRSLDDGSFALRAPPSAGVVDLLVGAFEGEPPSPLGIGVALGSVTVPHAGLVVRLAEPASLEGVVVGLNADPVPATVDVLRLEVDPVPFRTRMEAPDGTFRLARARPGRYAVRARPHTPTVGAVTETAEIVLPGGVVRLVVREPGRLRGPLVGEDAAGFRVLLIEDDVRFGREQREMRTGSDGRFEFLGLREPVRVVARRGGDDRYADLVVTPGPAEIDVLLHPGQRIEGRLLKGPPYSGARVLARQGGIEVDVLLEADGAFSLRGLAPGEWRLFVTNRSEGQGFAMEWGVDLDLLAEAGSTGVLVR